MSDPYKILGVDRNASDEEIKRAYRKLSRQYHPDSNIGKSEAEQRAAEEKFKEIQRAYKAIINGEANSGPQSYGSGFGQGGTYGGYGYGSYGGGQQQSASMDQDEAYYQACANFIRNRMYEEALRTLNDIKNRNGRWYYFSSMANAGLGNTAVAQSNIQRACELEPYNNEYRQFMSRLQNGGSGWYGEMGQSYGAPDMGASSFCMKLCLLNVFCNVCCGGGMCCGPGFYM